VQLAASVGERERDRLSREIARLSDRLRAEVDVRDRLLREISRLREEITRADGAQAKTQQCWLLVVALALLESMLVLVTCWLCSSCSTRRRKCRRAARAGKVAREATAAKCEGNEAEVVLAPPATLKSLPSPVRGTAHQAAALADISDHSDCTSSPPRAVKELASPGAPENVQSPERDCAQQEGSPEAGEGSLRSPSAASSVPGTPGLHSGDQADHERDEAGVVAEVNRLLEEWSADDPNELAIFEEMEDELRHYRLRAEAVRPLVRGLSALRGEYVRLMEAGSSLVDDLQRLHEENRENAGDAAYWRTIAEEFQDQAALQKQDAGDEDFPRADEDDGLTSQSVEAKDSQAEGLSPPSSDGEETPTRAP
jgi:hypothetical protein